MPTRNQWATLETTTRIARHGVRFWWALALAVCFASPVGPHLRIEQRIDGACIYAGSRGVLAPAFVPGCPLLAWLDARGMMR